MKERNSNIELLRLIAMSFIVMGHFVLQSGITENSSLVEYGVLSILGQGSRIATNLFLIIACWYMVDSKTSGKKIVHMYLHLYFYTCILTTAMVSTNSDCSIKDVIRGYVPFFGRALWFISAYLTLVFIEPFLKKVLLLSKKELTVLAVLLLIFFSVVSTLPDLQDCYLVDAIWFWIVYVLVGCFKKYYYEGMKAKIYSKRVIFLIAGLFLYLILCSGMVFGHMNNKGLFSVIKRLSYQYLYDIKTIPNILIAACIFIYFISIKEKRNKVVCSIASITMGVYIFHQVPAFYPRLWELFKNNVTLSVGSPILVCLIVLIVAGLIEKLIWKHIDKALRKVGLVGKLGALIDRLYEGV